VNFLEAPGFCFFWFFFRFVFFTLITAVYHRHTRNCPHCYCRPVIRGLPTANTTRLPPPSRAFAWRSADFRVYNCRAGEAVLRQTARALTREEITGDEIQRLIQDMKETMQDAPGVGLAAPQVGPPLRLAVIEDREELLKGLPPQEVRDKERRPVPFHVTINPDITFSRDDTVHFYEGCLSLAGFSAVVPRARTIQVRYLDEHGEHHG
jgi:peptide deformylase